MFCGCRSRRRQSCRRQSRRCQQRLAAWRNTPPGRDAEAERLVGLGAIRTVTLYQEGLDHYAVGMKDPEGNEFDIN
ncbi:MAG TPA: VOC family protein [Actinocrinis sp.]|nr:VOC family protein [Actinocrinis sp.]